MCKGSEIGSITYDSDVAASDTSFHARPPMRRARHQLRVSFVDVGHDSSSSRKPSSMSRRPPLPPGASDHRRSTIGRAGHTHLQVVMHVLLNLRCRSVVKSTSKAKRQGTCIASRAAYCSCSGTVRHRQSGVQSRLQPKPSCAHGL